MAYALPILAIVAIVFGPAAWAKFTLHRHGSERTDLPGTGGQLAEHLVESLGLDGVIVERTDGGSHYDPAGKAVRLEPRFFDGRSVSAVAVAAHEVGHAVQDHADYAPLRTRHRLILGTQGAQKIARVALYAAPFAGLAGRHPGFALTTILIGIVAMGIPVAVHLVTLPVEFDASYGRALPVLERGRYLGEDDMPAANSALRACALTYVGASLVSMFNLWRWLRVLR